MADEIMMDHEKLEIAVSRYEKAESALADARKDVEARDARIAELEEALEHISDMSAAWHIVGDPKERLSFIHTQAKEPLSGDGSRIMDVVKAAQALALVHNDRPSIGYNVCFGALREALDRLDSAEGGG